MSKEAGEQSQRSGKHNYILVNNFSTDIFLTRDPIQFFKLTGQLMIGFVSQHLDTMSNMEIS